VIEETVDPGGDKVDRVLSAVERLERKLAALEAKLK
jgi:ubiquinone biosynthesis protein UbiJ